MITRRFRPSYSITRKMRAPGGMTLAAALERAEQALEDVRASCVTAIDAKIDRLVHLAGAGAIGDEMYDLAGEVFSEAGTFGLKEVSAAAHSLCELLSSDAGAKARAAVNVHVDALRALRHPDVCDDDERRVAVLRGLQAVAARFSETP